MAQLLGLLPLLLQFLGAVLKWYGASGDVMKKYLELIDSAHADGLIPIETRDKFLDQKARIEAKLKAEADKNAT